MPTKKAHKDVRILERAMGIEPTTKAWEAFILPLNYAREQIEFITSSKFVKIIIINKQNTE